MNYGDAIRCRDVITSMMSELEELIAHQAGNRIIAAYLTMSYSKKKGSVNTPVNFFPELKREFDYLSEIQQIYLYIEIGYFDFNMNGNFADLLTDQHISIMELIK